MASKLLIEVIPCGAKVNLVKLLIESDADVTADNNYAIWYASRYGYAEIVKES